MDTCPLCDSEMRWIEDPPATPMRRITCPECDLYRISTLLVTELQATPNWNEERQTLSNAVRWASGRQRVSLQTVRDVLNLNVAFARSERALRSAPETKGK
jgi:hypothetical protein